MSGVVCPPWPPFDEPNGELAGCGSLIPEHRIVEGWAECLFCGLQFDTTNVHNQVRLVTGPADERYLVEVAP